MITSAGSLIIPNVLLWQDGDNRRSSIFGGQGIQGKFVCLTLNFAINLNLLIKDSLLKIDQMHNFIEDCLKEF
jgi:hypothetical protein